MGTKNEERWLELHKKHLGLYARVAKTLGVSHTYLTLVANGKRRSETIMAELLKELRKIS